MRRFIRISHVYWTRWWISGWICAALSMSGCMSRAPSLRMLDTRAGYDQGLDDEEVALYQRGKRSGGSFARPGGPRIAKVYLYPHELPSRDYFWGGYVSLVVAKDELVFEDPRAGESNAETPEVPKVYDAIESKKSAPIRRPVSKKYRKPGKPEGAAR